MKNRGMNTAPVNRSNRDAMGSVIGVVRGGPSVDNMKLKRNFSETAHDFAHSSRAVVKMGMPGNVRGPSCPKTSGAGRSDSFTGATDLHRTESDAYSFRPLNKTQEVDQQSAGALSTALKLTLQKSDINYIKEILKKKDRNAISEIAAANRTRSPSTAKNAANLSSMLSNKRPFSKYSNK